MPTPPARTPSTPSLAGTSFAKTADARRRLIIALDALEKNGKTHFGLTAPRPTAILNFDIGLEGVVDKFSNRDGVVTANYNVNVVPGDINKTAAAADNVWKQLMTDYHWALKNMRSIVVDTGSEAWETLRLARFGKLTQVMPHHYGPVNAEYRKLLRAAFDHDANVIFLHKLKPEYETKVGKDGKEVSNKIHGAFKRAGMSETGFLVQLNAMSYRGDPDNPPVVKGDYYTNVTYDPSGTFNMFIRDCRQNAQLAGQVIPEHLYDFATVAQMVVDGSSEKDWV